MKRVTLLALAITATIGMIGCAKQQPQKEEPKKLVPKDLNGTTETSTHTSGTVYASDRNLYLQECQNGIGRGCRKLGALYELGLGVKKDLYKARHYVEKGCELGSGDSCNRAGNYYEYKKFNLPIDTAKAASYYHKGCELNYALACNNIGSSYTNGVGVVKNLDLAETFLQKSIRLGYNAYNNLGYLYQMKGDDVKAEEYYKKGCQLQSPFACANLGYLYQDQGRYTDAYNQLIKACNMSKGNACRDASMLIFNQKVNVDNPKQTIYQLNANACELNDAVGCSNLGYIYETGYGVPKDAKKAKKYYKKACKLGNKASCQKAK